MKTHTSRPLLLTCAALVLTWAAVDAHVRVTPPQSKTGATETYTARVPTEGPITTTGVQLDVPDGVTIVSASAPAGASYSLKREGERVVAVVWTTSIKPGDAQELSFVAHNPATGSAIIWKFHQRYADGTSRDWTGAPGSTSPAPATALTR